jgi:hypothetical protein
VVNVNVEEWPEAGTHLALTNSKSNNDLNMKVCKKRLYLQHQYLQVLLKLEVHPPSPSSFFEIIFPT